MVEANQPAADVVPFNDYIRCFTTGYSEDGTYAELELRHYDRTRMNKKFRLRYIEDGPTPRVEWLGLDEYPEVLYEIQSIYDVEVDWDSLKTCPHMVINCFII